jgi:hypothetical protein
MIDCHARQLSLYATFHTTPLSLICRLQYNNNNNNIIIIIIIIIIDQHINNKEFNWIIIIIKNWITYFFSPHNGWGDCIYWIFILV